tara:strand:- start:89 stop:526 length:438 start_codon:yes stop_codon:yes gene_type:complete
MENKMQKLFTAEFRPADILLDRVFNPARDPNTGNQTLEYLGEACGIIPDFFLNACLKSEDEGGITLQAICDNMDNYYQMGGFGQYPWKGTLDHRGTYQSEYEDDNPMPPLARFGFQDKAYCYVYDYGVVSVRLGLEGEYKIARFD